MCWIKVDQLLVGCIIDLSMLALSFLDFPFCWLCKIIFQGQSLTISPRDKTTKLIPPKLQHITMSMATFTGLD